MALVAQARVSEALGHIAEAVTGYQQAVELAGPAPVEAIQPDTPPSAGRFRIRLSLRPGSGSGSEYQDPVMELPTARRFSRHWRCR